MNLQNRSIFALLTLALCAPFAFAQDSSQTQPPPPAQQGQEQATPRGPAVPMGPLGRGSYRRPAMLFDDDGTQIDHPMRRGMARRQNMWARNDMGPEVGLGGRGGFGGSGAIGRFGARGRGMMPLERIVNDPDLREKLGITSEQAARIRQQDFDFRKASVTNRAKLEVAHIELEQLMSADKPDRAAIDKKLSDVSAAQLAAEQSRVHHQLDMKTALTPEQQAKLKELMQSRGRGMGGPGGPQGPGRGERGRPRPPQGTGSGMPADSTDGVSR